MQPKETVDFSVCDFPGDNDNKTVVQNEFKNRKKKF